MISADALKRWSSAYLASGKSDAWSEPALAPVEWWADAKTDQVLILAGQHEILFSAIDDFVERFKVFILRRTVEIIVSRLLIVASLLCRIPLTWLGMVRRMSMRSIVLR
jgi:hypothetical protein